MFKDSDLKEKKTYSDVLCVSSENNESVRELLILLCN